MKIGFIGTGIMGSRMAANLQKHGCELVVYNRTAEKAATLLENGAVWAETPAKVGQEADVLFTMLAHPKAVQESALGEQGFLDALQPKTIWVDCSTVNPTFSRQMAAEAQSRQVQFLDAPVAGSKNQAEQAQLVFIVGGQQATVERCQPFFEMMGSRVVHVGEEGMGISLKVVVNYLLATSMVSFAEGLVLGQALGIEQEMLFKVLLGGPVVPPYLSGKKEKLATGKYDTEFPLKWMQKDLQMAALAAYEVGVAMPLGSVAKDIYQLAIQQGLGQEDFSAIYSFLGEGR